MAIWTVTNVGTNNTDSNLHPKSPTSAAVWYGNIATSPGTIPERADHGQAGKFQATEGTATGTTGIVVYKSSEWQWTFFVLIMMPYGSGDMNETKVGFIDSKIQVNEDLVKSVWYDKNYGTSAEHTFAKDGQSATVYLESKIDQGKNVQATFTLSYK